MSDYTFRVSLDFLERHNQPLRDKVWDMLVAKKLDPAVVGFIVVDCADDYGDNKTMTELQHYVQTDAYRAAWMREDWERRHPKAEPLSGFAALMKAKLKQHS
jgi:hypothetical protein